MWFLPQIYNQGLRNLDLWFVLRYLCMPVIGCLGMALAIPYIIARSFVPMMGMLAIDCNPLNISTNYCSLQLQCAVLRFFVIGKIINDISAKNSSGPDGINTIFLKLVKHDLISPLTNIVNQTLSTGIFPDRLEIAKVIPIYKKGDSLLAENYRPISLLSSLSKIFEKVMLM